jgi:hypothetical protein
MEVVLDPHTVELATPNGFERPVLASLPWAGQRIHRPNDFQGASVAEVADRIAKLTGKQGFNAVLAPTHYIESSHDPWLTVDRRLTLRLRRQLDFGGHEDTPIYYPLVLPRKLLIDADQRSELIGMLMQLPIDAVWLRVYPFGSNCGATSLRSYIDASRDFQQLGIPIIAERTGTIGLALMAFGAVGGSECGVTTGKRFDMGTLTRPQKADGKGFSPAPRVYIDSLGIFLKRERAKAFFAARGAKTHFACQDPKCCRRGWQSMVEDPRRHFFYSRVGEVGRLSEAPASVRPGLYLEEFLRPATDLSLRAAKIDPRPGEDEEPPWELAANTRGVAEGGRGTGGAGRTGGAAHRASSSGVMDRPVEVEPNNNQQQRRSPRYVCGNSEPTRLDSREGRNQGTRNCPIAEHDARDRLAMAERSSRSAA